MKPSTEKKMNAKRGTIGYAINQLVKKHGQGTIGLYILEQALIKATGTDGIYFRNGTVLHGLLHETPNYKKHEAEQTAILHSIQATGAVKPSDRSEGRLDDGLAVRHTTGQTEVCA